MAWQWNLPAARCLTEKPPTNGWRSRGSPNARWDDLRRRSRQPSALPEMLAAFAFGVHPSKADVMQQAIAKAGELATLAAQRMPMQDPIKRSSEQSGGAGGPVWSLEYVSRSHRHCPSPRSEGALLVPVAAPSRCACKPSEPMYRGSCAATELVFQLLPRADSALANAGAICLKSLKRRLCAPADVKQQHHKR